MIEITAIDMDKVKDTFTLSKKVFFPNIDGSRTFLYCGDCYYCQAQKTAFWCHETDEAFCIVCKARTELHTLGMVELYDGLMEIQKQIAEDSDGFEIQATKDRIANNYSEYLEIKRLIYSDGYRELAPLMRQHKVYRVRSKSLSDEDRLFILIHIYRDRNHHRTKDMNAKEQFDDFKSWLRQSSDQERNTYAPQLSRAERRRIIREANKNN